MIRFFYAGGHDAGTGLYPEIPGIDVLITDKARLAILINDGPVNGPDGPAMAALNKLRSPFGKSEMGYLTA